MAAITSAATGNWNATGTWTGGVVPGSADTVTIQSPHNVTITAPMTAPSAITVASGGTLTNGYTGGTITLKDITVNGSFGAGSAANRTLITGQGIFAPGSSLTGMSGTTKLAFGPGVYHYFRTSCTITYGTIEVGDGTGAAYLNVDTATGALTIDTSAKLTVYPSAQVQGTNSGVLTVKGTINIGSGGAATYAAATDVRLGVNRGDGTLGTLNLPAVTDVKLNVSYDNGTKVGTYNPGAGSYCAASDVRTGINRGDGVTGTLVVPTAGNVRSGTTFDNGTTGTCVVPTVANVRQGTSVDVGLTGTCYVPTAANVKWGVNVDNTTGTCYVPAANNVRSSVQVAQTTGTLVVPIAGDVRQGITFDNGTAGVLNLPAVSDVRQGVTFDNGTQTGTLVTSGGGGTLSSANLNRLLTTTNGF